MLGQPYLITRCKSKVQSRLGDELHMAGKPWWRKPLTIANLIMGADEVFED